MFTGIIEEVGTVSGVERREDAYVIMISAAKVLEDAQVGDSIAVNGTCLTVTTMGSGRFSADVMPETLKATALQQIQPGTKVNLERAMPANGRFGGHIVSGHVDGVGTVSNLRKVANAVYYDINTPRHLLRYMIPKGSIAVDGISLTIVDVTEKHFSISVIPHTLQHTNLQTVKPGHLVNLETDMLAKYVERLVAGADDKNASEQQKDTPRLTRETLSAHGYV
jgi:riboflavin synthase